MSRKPTDKQIAAVVAEYEKRVDEFSLFAQQVAGFFQSSRQFREPPLPLVHSVKSRVKEIDHFRAKVARKH